MDGNEPHDNDPIRSERRVFGARRDSAVPRLRSLEPRLLAVRDEVLADAAAVGQRRPVPPEKQPLDAGFHELPERLLAELA